MKTKFNVETTLVIEFLHIVKHSAIGSAAFQEKGGTIYNLTSSRDSSGQRLMRCAYTALVIVASLSGSLCSPRQGITSSLFVYIVSGAHKLPVGQPMGS